MLLNILFLLVAATGLHAAPSPRTLSKHGITVPASWYGNRLRDSIPALEERATDSVVASNIGLLNKRHTVPVSIGFPPQVLKMVLDTGSSDFWVFSNEVPQEQLINKRTPFDLRVNKRGEVEPCEFIVNYGDDTGAQGVNCISTTVSVEDITFATQTVEIANTVTRGDLFEEYVDGFIGMGFSGARQATPGPGTSAFSGTFFDNFIDPLNQNNSVFGAYLPRDKDGAFDFGLVDGQFNPTHYEGDINWIDIDLKHSVWSVPITTISFGEADPVDMGGALATADTGTSIIWMNPATVAAYWKEAGVDAPNSKGYYTFDCTSELPALEITIGGKVATIPGYLMNFSPPGTKKECMGALQAREDVNILGGTFFNVYYGIFDRSLPTPRFGWATLK